MNRLLLCVVLCSGSLAGSAQLHLSKIFADSMVLQRDRPIPVWGWAGQNEKLTVQFNKQSKKVTAGADGRWQVKLDPETAGGPYDLTVTGAATVQLHGILTGDVWICSGQSNMNFRVNAVRNAQQEIQQANYPNIRHFQVLNAISGEPLDDIKQPAGSWKAATPANVGNFTAAGYFFARDLYETLKVPIGLIHTSWGGTDIETWISREGFNADELLGETVKAMPVLTTDALNARWQQTIINNVNKLQTTLPDAVKVAEWKAASFDDSKWPQMKLPSYWERQQLANVDGTVWFRKTVTIDAGAAGKEAVLQLGRIEDADEAYVNGVKVGATNDGLAKRIYTIPAGLLQAGKNVIAVRVVDKGGNGGIIGDSALMQFTADGISTPLAGNWRFQVESLLTAGLTTGPNSYPSLLYNAMIHPLLPFAIKGAIWYQGENNAGRAYQYRKAFPLMINDWRKQWKQGDFPFYFVQLASFKANNGTSATGSNWAELREAQTLTLSLPNTGMAVTTDIGETNDIHPKNKQDVGKRLAAVALRDTYRKNVLAAGPTYKEMHTEGNLVTISYTELGGGLTTKAEGATIKGFEIAGKDQEFYPAQAAIRNNQIVLTAPEVGEPVAVRYAWADDAGEANLFNKEGFPAAPFRTDQWKAKTDGTKYTIKL